MKTRSSKQIRFLTGLCLALLATGPWAAAQTEAELDIQTYAGLTITGEIGKVYSIEYVTDLTEPAESDWRCLEYLQLPASPYQWADKSSPATGRRFYRAVAMEPPENMVFIPPGTFRMGSPEDEQDRQENEGPQTQVTLTQGFWMGKYEVSQGEYEAVMGNNPSYYNGVRVFLEDTIDYGTDLTRPVEWMPPDDAMAYCAALTERERGAGRIASNAVYRLPTEAEWEYACRGLTSTRFSYGDDPGYTNLADYAWCSEYDQSGTHPVGQKLPNPWGLHDMHGSVWEWCQDWYPEYPGGSVLDPQGPATENSVGTLRGGGTSIMFGRRTRDCRSASRKVASPAGIPTGLIGFRVVLAPAQP